jgi:hypothetical protein
LSFRDVCRRKWKKLNPVDVVHVSTADRPNIFDNVIRFT